MTDRVYRVLTRPRQIATRIRGVLSEEEGLRMAMLPGAVQYDGVSVTSTPDSDPIELVVTWCFPHGRHKPNTYKTTRPDTDNLEKLLKDCMTAAGYWQDDALVVREIVEKYWTEVPGIRIRVSEL